MTRQDRAHERVSGLRTGDHRPDLLVDALGRHARTGEFACTLEELIATNLALALYGTTTTITPGTVTGELLPNPVTPGSLYPLAMQNVSAVQIQDSDATPQTLPVSQYSVNAKHGSPSSTKGGRALVR